MTESASPSTTTPQSLRHVVLFAFNDSAAPDDVERIRAAFCALPSAIDTIVDFEWGTNNSPEHINDGFTHCFLLTFGSGRDRDAYLVHLPTRPLSPVYSPISPRRSWSITGPQGADRCPKPMT